MTKNERAKLIDVQQKIVAAQQQLEQLYRQEKVLIQKLVSLDIAQCEPYTPNHWDYNERCYVINQ